MKNLNSRNTDSVNTAVRFLIFPFLLAIAGDAGAYDGNPIKNAISDLGYMATSPARIDSSGAYTTLGVLGAGALFYTYNNQIRREAKKLKDADRDRFILQAEKLGNGGYDLALLGVLGGTGHLIKNEKLENTAILSFESFLAANAFGTVTKVVVGLSRPYTGRGDASFKPFSLKSDNNSFPSGHTTTAFSIASVFTEQYDSPWVSILSYGLAASVAAQRVYADMHWASDVFFGAALGTVTGRLVVRRARRRAAGKAKTLTIFPYVSPVTATSGLGLKLAF